MKKAQASMEYVSTYIYAGLALVVVVGAMGYFGAFNPSTYAKESCESGEQLSCADAQITTDGVIGVMLANNHDRYINITNYTITYNGEDYPVLDANITIPPNQNASIDFDTTDIEFNKGKKESFDYTVAYTPEGSTRLLQLSGSATTRVEEEFVAQCGNRLIESPEECDLGPEGGWISPADYSCKSYLTALGEINNDTLTHYQVTGEVWCSNHCEFATNNQNASERGCQLTRMCCDGIAGCVPIGEISFQTIEKEMANDLDICSVAGWVDCESGVNNSTCPYNSYCENNECICDGCEDRYGMCIPVGSESVSSYDNDNIDFCVDQGIWQDCRIDVPSSCKPGEQCMNGTCERPLSPAELCGNGQLDNGEECDFNITGDYFTTCPGSICNPDCSCPLPTDCLNDYTCFYNDTCYYENNHSAALITIFNEEFLCENATGEWQWTSMTDLGNLTGCTGAFNYLGWPGDNKSTCCEHPYFHVESLIDSIYLDTEPAYEACCNEATDCASLSYDRTEIICYNDQDEHPEYPGFICEMNIWVNNTQGGEIV